MPQSQHDAMQHQAKIWPKAATPKEAERMMTDEDMQRIVKACNDIGRQLQAGFAPIWPDVRRTFNRLHGLLFPDEAKRLMLREARHRARLSTQRRRARQ